MDDELRSKIEEVVEEKVEESLEEDADTKFSKLVDRKIERKLREGKIEATKEISSDNEMNRRSFLKILGLSSAGIGLASSATAANLLQGTKINGNTVFHQGNDYSGTGSSSTALDADQVDGFDIQKNGNDTTGVINFNTNQKTITVDGDIVVAGVLQATGGTTVTTFTDNNGQQYRIHAFENTGTSTFTVDSAPPNSKVDVLVVGGGGGGGTNTDSGFFHSAGAGGGAGGVVSLTDKNIASGSYDVTVGSGGQGGRHDPTDNSHRGENTGISFLSQDALGGGAGMDQGDTVTNFAANKNGGSGGGQSRKKNPQPPTGRGYRRTRK